MESRSRPTAGKEKPKEGCYIRTESKNAQSFTSGMSMSNKLSCLLATTTTWGMEEQEEAASVYV
jgi:hypothetical protein